MRCLSGPVKVCNCDPDCKMWAVDVKWQTFCEVTAVKLLAWLVCYNFKTHRIKRELQPQIFTFLVNTWTPTPHFPANPQVKSDAMWAAGKRIYQMGNFITHPSLPLLTLGSHCVQMLFFLLNDFKVRQNLTPWWGSNRKQPL